MDSPKSYTVRTETGEIRLMSREEVGHLVRLTMKNSSRSGPKPKITCSPEPSPRYTSTSQRLSRSPRNQLPRKFQFRSAETKRYPINVNVAEDEDENEPRSPANVEDRGEASSPRETAATSPNGTPTRKALSPSSRSVTELVSTSIRNARQNAKGKKTTPRLSFHYGGEEVTTSPVKLRTFSWSLDTDENNICGDLEDLVVSDESGTMAGNTTLGETTMGDTTFNDDTHYDGTTLDGEETIEDTLETRDAADTFDDTLGDEDDDKTVNTVNTGRSRPKKDGNETYKIFRSFFETPKTQPQKPEIADIIQDTMRRARETAMGKDALLPAQEAKTSETNRIPVAKEARFDETVLDEIVTAKSNSESLREPIECKTEASMSAQETSLSAAIHGAREAVRKLGVIPGTPRPGPGTPRPSLTTDFGSHSETPRLFNGKKAIKTFSAIEEIHEEMGFEVQIGSTSGSDKSPTPVKVDDKSSQSTSTADEKSLTSLTVEEKSDGSTTLTNTPLIADSRIEVYSDEPKTNEDEQNVCFDSRETNEESGHDPSLQTKDIVSTEKQEIESIDTATAAEEILSVEDSDSSAPFGQSLAVTEKVEDTETHKKLSIETALYSPQSEKMEPNNVEGRAKSTTAVPSRPLLMVKQCPSSDDEYPLAASVRKTLSESLHSTTSSRGRRSTSMSDSSFKNGSRRMRSKTFRPNRKRSESAETGASSLITDDFLATIASMKGEEVTAEELGRLLQEANGSRTKQKADPDSDLSLDSMTGNCMRPIEGATTLSSFQQNFCFELLDLFRGFNDEDVREDFANDSNYDSAGSDLLTDPVEDDCVEKITTDNNETANDETENYETDGFEIAASEKPRVTFSFSDGMQSSTEDDTTATTGGW